MEMSLSYMEETVSFMQERGFEVAREEEELVDDSDATAQIRRFVLRRGAEEHLELETVSYPDGKETYYLAIPRLHSLSSFSFPLDSWKYRDAYVEFKYYAPAETGVGLSFKLAL